MAKASEVVGLALFNEAVSRGIRVMEDEAKKLGHDFDEKTLKLIKAAVAAGVTATTQLLEELEGV